MPTPSAPWLNDGQITTIWAEGGTPPPSSCDNFYRSRRFADYFYKECPTGQIGSGVYFIVPEGKFWSMIDQADADAQAIAFLEEQGQAAADLNGECKLGDFTEVFTSMQAAVNWDWVEDKRDTWSLPFYAKSYVQTTAYTILPLINITYFNGLTGSGLPTQQVYTPFDIEDTHGLMHIDYSGAVEGREDLLAATWVTTGAQAANLVPFQTYGGFLLGDFGSTEIFGDAEGHGAFSLGGMLGIIETAESFNAPFVNGHFTGYIIAYKEEISIWKWDDELEGYDLIVALPTSLQNRTVYVGYGIRYDRGQWAAELYLNGAWQYSLFDDNVVSFTMMRYQRGVLSMDYWFGDLVIGSMSPFTNRVPPALTVKNFAPAELYLDYPDGETRPDNFPLMVPQGTALTAEEAIAGPVMLRTEQPVKSLGFSETVPGSGGYTFPVAQWGVRWDPNLWEDDKIEKSERLFGVAPFFTYRWSKEYIAPFPYGMNRVYEGVFSTDDELYFFNCSDVEFPAIIPDLSVFNDEPYNDFAFLAPTRNRCLPGGYDRPLIQEDMLEPYTWATMEHQPFPFDGLMYTKDYVASRWIYFYLNPQSDDNVDEPTLFNFHMPFLRMFSGSRGIRTRDILPAPVYDNTSCPYPSCIDPRESPILQSGMFGFEGISTEMIGATADICDKLFPGLKSVDQGTWNWEITLKDYEEGGARKVQLILGMISPKLMDDFLQSSSQLLPLVSGQETIRLILWRTDWPLPVWDKVMTIDNYILNVPPLPPSGGPGMPPEATIIYTGDGTLDPEPSFADETGIFYLHIFRSS